MIPWTECRVTYSVYKILIDLKDYFSIRIKHKQMSPYFLLLLSKWIALYYSWNIENPGLHGPPLENIVQGTISHIGKDVPILKDLLISVTQPFYRK